MEDTFHAIVGWIEASGRLPKEADGRGAAGQRGRRRTIFAKCLLPTQGRGKPAGAVDGRVEETNHRKISHFYLI